MGEDRTWCCQGCGTYSGYQRHTKNRETPCGPCRDANRDYTRQYRANRADVRANDRRYNRTRRRAYARLAQMYPDDARRLWFEELAKDPA